MKKKSLPIIIAVVALVAVISSCNADSNKDTSDSDSSVAEITADENKEEIVDTPDNELTDLEIGKSVTIYGVTVTVDSIDEAQTSTGAEAYEVNITYKNNSGSLLSINPYDWTTVLHTGSDKAHVGGNGSFNLDNLSDGEEWTGIVTLWRDDDTEKIKFESSSLNMSKDDKKSATWLIPSQLKTTTNMTASTSTTTTTTTTVATTVPTTTISTTTAQPVVTTIVYTEPPTIPPTSPPVIRNESRTVYYTETGSKYHYDSQCGRGTYYPCTIDEAIGMGLEPCKKCT